MRGLFIKNNKQTFLKLRVSLIDMGYSPVKQDIYFSGTMVTSDGNLRHPVAPFKPWNPDGKGWPECEVFDNEADFLKAAEEMISDEKAMH